MKDKELCKLFHDKRFLDLLEAALEDVKLGRVLPFDIELFTPTKEKPNED